MTAWVRALRLASAAAVGIAGGASCGDEAFLCDDHQDCSGVEGGLCEPVGYCSQPSLACPSGREYAAHSGGLTGQCVMPSVGDGSSGGEASDTSGAEQGSTGDDGPGDTSGSADDGEATGALTTGPETSGGDTTGGMVVDACPDGTLLLLEDFERSDLSALDWWLDGDGNAGANVVDGVLALYAEAWTEGDDVWTASVDQDLPTHGRLSMEVVSPPSQPDAIVWVELWGEGNNRAIEIYEDNLVSAYWDGMGYPWNADIPLVPDQHRFLALTWDREDGWLDLDVSADGQTWWYFDGYELDFAVEGASFGGGIVEDYDFEGDFALVDNVILCSFD